MRRRTLAAPGRLFFAKDLARAFGLGLALLVLSLAPASVLSGTPPLGEPSHSVVSAVVQPASGTVTVSLTISPSQITEGQSISVQASANGGTPPYSYAYAGLPDGCQGQNQASFSCNPSSTGSFNVQVTATDSQGNESSPSNSVSVDVTGSSGGNNNNGNNNGNGNNSSNPLSSLFSGFSGILSLLLIFGLVGFITWVLLVVGIWVIAITLVRRLPKRGGSGPPVATGPCPACSASVPAGSKFCPSCGTSMAPKTP